MKKERGVIVDDAERRRARMTPHARRTAEQEGHSEDELVSLLQEGQNAADRALLHSCLLKRRLQLGADSADLLQIVHAIQFAIEDLQGLLRSAVQAVTPVPGSVPPAGEAPAVANPLRAEVVDLRARKTLRSHRDAVNAHQKIIEAVRAALV